MEPKTGKRIVSKSAYIKTQGQRGVIESIAVVCWITSLILLFFTLSYLYLLSIVMWSIGDTDVRAAALNYTIWACCTGTGTFICSLLARKATKSAQRINPGIPLTRANTARLPAPDSLVRASSEPMQAQEGVLVRAATQKPETPPEQLVRAVER